VLAAFGAVLSPRRVPSASYQWFVDSAPMARPWLYALALCGAIAMVVNDFGVLLPAIMTGFVLPLLVCHLVSDPPAPHRSPTPPARTREPGEDGVDLADLADESGAR
jgi:hypothetical protein